MIRTKTLVKMLFVSGFALLFFSFDRLSKLWAEESLLEDDVSVIGNFFRFHLTYNQDIAFSIPVPQILTIVLSVTLLIFLAWYFSKSRSLKGFLEIIAASLIFGGALGNLFDRLLYSQVVDFIAVGSFPVFNLADSFLFCGVIFFLGREIYCSRN